LDPALNSLNGGDDPVGVSGPHEGLGLGIGFFEEAMAAWSWTIDRNTPCLSCR
jgi:hypothetical protein